MATNTKSPNEDLAKEVEEAIRKLITKVEGFVYPLIIPPLLSIDEDILFDVYLSLKAMGRKAKLNVLLYSYGGDAHTAFHIGRLLQGFAADLSIYILREAKSAATLLACSADRIIFSEISELGPVDPQISDPLNRERFSPLAIKHALDLIAAQSTAGHSELVKALADKLPKPLILGEHIKSLETSKEYIFKLLKGKMLKNERDEKVRAIAEKLTVGYPDHNYCIDDKEAEEIGLVIEKVPTNLEIEIFEVMNAYKKVSDKFDQLFKKGDSQSKDEAVSILISLERSSKSILRSQYLQSKNNSTRQKKDLGNNKPNDKQETLLSTNL